MGRPWFFKVLVSVVVGGAIGVIPKQVKGLSLGIQLKETTRGEFRVYRASIRLL